MYRPSKNPAWDWVMLRSGSATSSRRSTAVTSAGCCGRCGPTSRLVCARQDYGRSTACSFRSSCPAATITAPPGSPRSAGARGAFLSAPSGGWPLCGDSRAAAGGFPDRRRRQRRGAGQPPDRGPGPRHPTSTVDSPTVQDPAAGRAQPLRLRRGENPPQGAGVQRSNSRRLIP